MILNKRLPFTLSIRVSLHIKRQWWDMNTENWSLSVFDGDVDESEHMLIIYTLGSGSLIWASLSPSSSQMGEKSPHTLQYSYES